MVSLNKTTFGVLKDTSAYAANAKKNESSKLQELNLSEIVNVEFPENQYYKEQTAKKQIVLHHTVSGLGVEGDISYWRQSIDRIATAIIIGADGKIYQCFASQYWGHHIGLHAVNNVALNKASIGIEIDAWGGLIKYRNQWYPSKYNADLKKNVANIAVKPVKNVYEIPEGYRGYYGFEKYTDAQIESVGKLLKYWSNKYNIPLTYNEGMFEVSQEALAGKPGVYSHSSFRADKSDIYPDDRLISMLKSLQ